MIRLLLMVVVTTLFFALVRPSQAQEEWSKDIAMSADQTEIAYYQFGTRSEKPPLVIISGGPGSDRRYMLVGGSFERIAEDRQVIGFDQRGTGKSGRASETPTLSDWIDDVEAIRDAVKASKIDIIGHSFGGMVAMGYAERHPSYVNKVIFVNSTGPTLEATENALADMFPDRVEEWQNVRRTLAPRFRAEEIQVFTSMEFVDLSKGAVFMDTIKDYIYNIEVNNALRQDMAALDFTESLRGAEYPALILHGRYDPVITPSTAWALHQLVPQSKIAIMDATGHLPFAERPDIFVDSVRTFLDDEN